MLKGAGRVFGFDLVIIILWREFNFAVVPTGMDLALRDLRVRERRWNKGRFIDPSIFMDAPIEFGNSRAVCRGSIAHRYHFGVVIGVLPDMSLRRAGLL